MSIQAILFEKTYETKRKNKWLSDHNLSHRTTDKSFSNRISTPDYNKYMYRI